MTRRNSAPKPCVDLLKTPKPLIVQAEFLKNMVPYPPLNPDISEKHFSVAFRKGITYPYKRNTIFQKISRQCKNPSWWMDRTPPPPPGKTPTYISTPLSP